MNAQITRNNHYVPQWYQRGFLQENESRLHVLDLSPGARVLPDGRVLQPSPLSQLSPKRILCARDLYTTRFGETLNDDVEKFLFGAIDKRGAEAVRALIDNDTARIHSHFGSLFDYLDTQKLRTPKGLDWILARYQNQRMTQVDLMVEMQRLRDMHCKMWSESVREIVSAASSPVKFLVSDHPVTVYHREFPPDAVECRYPHDPGIDLVGSQTVFALDADHCLILTNLEYAKSPDTVDVLAQRTNARFRGQSLVRTDAFIRKRELAADEVAAINQVLKCRARRYLAAGRVEWLTPELANAPSWRQIGEILLPRDDLWRFGGEIYVGYADGSSRYQDPFGRTSHAHEYLSKQPPELEPEAEAYCPCGNGLSYAHCCKETSPRRRPSWTSYSVRERNLMLCNAVRDVLGLDDGKSWNDVRRELSDDQVKRIHEIFESLWPLDTLLREILPPPRKGVLRALFMGHLDARTLAMVATGWLGYFDEIVLSHPFVNAATINPEYSPTQTPQSYKDQTLRNVLILLELEEHIRAGRVHLIPDPTDLDPPFRQEMLAMVEPRRANVKFSAEDARLMELLGKDDFRRWTLRGSDEQLAAVVRKGVPDIPAESVDEVVALMKKELEDDPLALLQPITPGEDGTQLLTIKGFTLETGLYTASLTGSIIYCQMDAMWTLLHQSDGERQVTTTQSWTELCEKLGQIGFTLPLSENACSPNASAKRDAIRQVLRLLVHSARSGSSADLIPLNLMLDGIDPDANSDGRSPDSGCFPVQLKLSVPEGGFYRKEVTRLVLTYGLSTQVSTVPLAMQIWFNPDA